VSNVHLSPDQLAAWLAGDQPADVKVHLERCSRCQAEIAGFEDAISNFRSGIHAIADRREAVILTQSRPRFALRAAPAWGWALAAACVAVLAVVPFYKTGSPPPHAIQPAPVAVAELSDAALFEQMDAQLARSVPRSMEPLAALAWTANDIGASFATTQGNQ
jgi:hypothetical protein